MRLYAVAEAARRYRDLQRRYLDAQLDRAGDATLHELIDMNQDLYEQVAEAEEDLFAVVSMWEHSGDDHA